MLQQQGSDDVSLPANPSNVRLLRIHRDANAGYGFLLVGNAPVQIQSVDPAGPAEKAGVVVGDQIMGINGVNVLNATHKRVVNIIRHAGESIELMLLAAPAPASQIQTAKNDYVVFLVGDADLPPPASAGGWTTAELASAATTTADLLRRAAARMPTKIILRLTGKDVCLINMRGHALAVFRHDQLAMSLALPSSTEHFALVTKNAGQHTCHVFRAAAQLVKETVARLAPMTTQAAPPSASDSESEASIKGQLQQQQLPLRHSRLSISAVGEDPGAPSIAIRLDSVSGGLTAVTTAAEAESKLRQAGSEGTFLVREDETGALFLSYVFLQAVKHEHIRWDEQQRGFLIKNINCGATLPEAIATCRQPTQNVLPISLSRPFSGRGSRFRASSPRTTATALRAEKYAQRLRTATMSSMDKPAAGSPTSSNALMFEEVENSPPAVKAIPQLLALRKGSNASTSSLTRSKSFQEALASPVHRGDSDDNILGDDETDDDELSDVQSQVSSQTHDAQSASIAAQGQLEPPQQAVTDTSAEAASTTTPEKKRGIRRSGIPVSIRRKGSYAFAVEAPRNDAATVTETARFEDEELMQLLECLDFVVDEASYEFDATPRFNFSNISMFDGKFLNSAVSLTVFGNTKLPRLHKKRFDHNLVDLARELGGTRSLAHAQCARFVNMCIRRNAAENVLDFIVAYDHKEAICPLFDAVTKPEHASLMPKSFNDTLTLAMGLVGGLGFLHDNDVVHGALNAHTVLVGFDGNIKLVDYGLGVLYAEADPEQSLDLLKYRAPELLLQPLSFSTASDVYSAGLLLSVLLLRKLPFEELETVDALVEAVVRRDAQPTLPDNANTDYCQAIRGCLVQQPRARVPTNRLFIMLMSMVDECDSESDDEDELDEMLKKHRQTAQIRSQSVVQPSWATPARTRESFDLDGEQVSDDDRSGEFDLGDLAAVDEDRLEDEQIPHIGSRGASSLSLRPPPFPSQETLQMQSVLKEQISEQFRSSSREGSQPSSRQSSAASLNHAPLSKTGSRASSLGRSSMSGSESDKGADPGSVDKVSRKSSRSSQVGTPVEEAHQSDNDAGPIAVTEAEEIPAQALEVASKRASSEVGESELKPESSVEPDSGATPAASESASAEPAPAAGSTPPVQASANTSISASASASATTAGDDDMDFFAMLRAQKQKEADDAMRWTVEVEEETEEEARLTGPARWGAKFDFLLANEEGMQVFMKYMRTTFCEENALFWRDTVPLKTCPEEEVPVLAKQVFDKYLSVNAPLPLNIDGPTRQRIAAKMKPVPQRDVFAAAQKQVYQLMKFDSYPRFLKSPLYLDLLDSAPPDSPAAAPVKKSVQAAKAAPKPSGDQLAPPASAADAAEGGDADAKGRKKSSKTKYKIFGFARGKKKKYDLDDGLEATPDHNLSLVPVPLDDNISDAGTAEITIEEPAEGFRIEPLVIEATDEGSPRRSMLQKLGIRRSKDEGGTSPSPQSSPRALFRSKKRSHDDPGSPRPRLGTHSKTSNAAAEASEVFDAPTATEDAAEADTAASARKGLKTIFRVTINKNRSFVQAEPGQTLLDAVQHLLVKFNLSAQVMNLHKVNDSQPIPWDAPAADFEQQELTLKRSVRMVVTFPNGSHSQLPIPSKATVRDVLDAPYQKRGLTFESHPPVAIVNGLLQPVPLDSSATELASTEIIISQRKASSASLTLSPPTAVREDVSYV
eukprot:m.14437 g.14437  ORF g.14437 m.14437 type:complete len:1706 (-) comp3370_c0_seq1:189-5306(-)